MTEILFIILVPLVLLLALRRRRAEPDTTMKSADQMDWTVTHPKQWFRAWMLSPLIKEQRQWRLRLPSPSISAFLDEMGVDPEKRPHQRPLVLGRGKYLGVLTWKEGTPDERVTVLLIQEEHAAWQRQTGLASIT